MNTPKFALKKYSEEMSSLEKAKNEKKIKSENETEEKRRERKKAAPVVLLEDGTSDEANGEHRRTNRTNRRKVSFRFAGGERTQERKKNKKEESKAKRGRLRLSLSSPILSRTKNSLLAP